MKPSRPAFWAWAVAGSFLAVFTLACAAFSPRGSVADSGPRREVKGADEARRFAAALRDSLHLPGLAVAVATKEGTAVDVVLGWANVDERVSVTQATRFRMGSISKLLTATAAARLVQEGKLDLDAPLTKYLATVPPDKRSITARQLAGHLSGIRHYNGDEFINRAHYGNVVESLGRFLDDTLLAAPGVRYSYSSYGYNLLGAVLQGATGEEFRSIVAREVLRPLGLGTIAVDSAGMPAVATFYSTDSLGNPVEVPAADLSDRWPSGGYVSTASDLARFGTGVLRRGFLAAKGCSLLFSSQRTADGRQTHVGLGWRTGVDSTGTRYLHHGGESLGGRAFLLVYPDQGVAVALMTNLSFARFGAREAIQLAKPFLRRARKD